MKPIESDLMEQEEPRVYRLVLTGGMTMTNILHKKFLLVNFCCVGNGKSRGFFYSSI